MKVRLLRAGQLDGQGVVIAREALRAAACTMRAQQPVRSRSGEPLGVASNFRVEQGPDGVYELVCDMKLGRTERQ